MVTRTRLQFYVYTYIACLIILHQKTTDTVQDVITFTHIGMR